MKTEKDTNEDEKSLLKQQKEWSEIESEESDSIVFSPEPEGNKDEK